MPEVGSPLSLDGNHVKSKPFQVIDASQAQQAA